MEASLHRFCSLSTTRSASILGGDPAWIRPLVIFLFFFLHHAADLVPLIVAGVLYCDSRQLAIFLHLRLRCRRDPGGGIERATTKHQLQHIKKGFY